MFAGAIWVALLDAAEATSVGEIGARLGLNVIFELNAVAACNATDSACSSTEIEAPLCAVVDPRLRSPRGDTMMELAWDQAWPMPVLILTDSRDAALITSLLQSPRITALVRPFGPEMLENAIAGLAASALRLRSAYVQRSHARDRIHRLPDACRSILEDVLRSEPIKRIARRHDLSTRTIEVRKKALFDHLGVGTYAELFELCSMAGVKAMPDIAQHPC